MGVTLARPRLDVDYLLEACRAGLPALDRPVVYRYRSGILRPRLHAILEQSAARDSRTVAPAALPPPNGFDFTGIIGSALFRYDWPKRPTRGLTRMKLSSALNDLSNSLPHPSIHAVPHGSEVAQHAAWRKIEADVLVLEEPVVTRESLRPILAYLAATTDLASDVDLLAQPGFVKSFGELVEARAELPAIMQAFDERVLVCLDPLTRRFDVALHTRATVRRSGRHALLPTLRNLTELRREQDLVDFVSGLDERRSGCGWTTAELLSEIYRKSSVLLRSSVPFGSRLAQRGRVSPRRIFDGGLLWAALLLAWEERLGSSQHEETTGYRRGPDTVVTNLAGLGRDFLARAPDVEDADPLAGRWSALGRTLGLRVEEGPLARPRAELLDAIEAAIVRTPGAHHGWILRLLVKVMAARSWLAPCDCGLEGMAQPETKTVAQSSVTTPPQSFATLIGRTRLVAALRRQAAQPESANNLLLHGPDGVGKRTLARVYARTILCEAPRAEGLACGVCTSCSYPDGSHPRIFSYDGASDRIASITGSVAGAIRSTFWGRRCVVIVDNADRYPPAIFDALLDPMENSTWASFVLLARDRRAVRLAGQSRCFDYPVRPLDDSEADAVLRVMLATHGKILDTATRALLIEASAGLPGRLHEACGIVAAERATSLAAIRTALGYGWSEAILSFWPALLIGDHSVLTELMRRWQISRIEATRRVQALLQVVHLCGVNGGETVIATSDLALRHLNEQRFEALAVMAGAQASREGVDVGVIWTRMIEMWLAETDGS